MKNANWSYPTNIWFGIERIKELQSACDTLSIKHPLIVTDPGILKTDIIEKIKSSLSNEVLIFSDVQGNPTGQNVLKGVSIFNKGGFDGVIAVGGGSAMDVGKGIAFLARQKRSLWDFEDIDDYWKRADSNNIFPIIAVPTTAGTGSETGRASVFTKEETKEKKIIFHPKMLPSLVILDPDLTIKLPKNLTAFTGMDVLAHCLEAYCSPNFHPLSQGIALEGILIVKNFLLRVYNDGTDFEARSNMLVGSAMGSTAFQKGLGAIHSLSHPVGAIYNTHHGLTNGVFMPYVLIRNKEAISDKLISLANYIDIKNKSFSGFLEWILELRNKLAIPHTLKELIKDNSKFKEMSVMAFNDPSTSTNPIKLDSQDFYNLYNDSYSGKL
ncbi:MAG: 1,3-propanediol dehydrogenase [Alphaproteobacteria bacterium MarineAlpha5_Bin9]|nr:MAG: 1,3-propanediol dehydrogenase [Alphaproteobacteria bacterium MarineAlpha5_Bin9]|tara:strand:+ start:12731 stop:13879 length:1149 start_codon:yes stop_codon:yes gene_type:complete